LIEICSSDNGSDICVSSGLLLHPPALTVSASRKIIFTIFTFILLFNYILLKLIICSAKNRMFATHSFLYPFSGADSRRVASVSNLRCFQAGSASAGPARVFRFAACRPNRSRKPVIFACVYQAAAQAVQLLSRFGKACDSMPERVVQLPL
jgi:hypothetical protein